MMVKGAEPLSCAEVILFRDVMLRQQKETVEVVLAAEILFEISTAKLFLHLSENLGALLLLLIGHVKETQQGPRPRRISREIERLLLASDLQRRLAMDIKDPAILIVSQDLVGLDKKPDPMLRPFAPLGILVRVRIENQPPVGTADFIPGGGLADSQDDVVIKLLPEFLAVGVVHSIAPARAGKRPAVQEHSDRAVVIEPNVHMSSEHSLSDLDPAGPKILTKDPVQFLRPRWIFRVEEGWPAPTAAVGLEGKLGNQQEFPPDIFQGTVHGVLFIRKNSQLDNLLSQLSSSFLAITFSDAKENQHPRSDRADDLPIDLNRGVPDSLK